MSSTPIHALRKRNSSSILAKVSSGRDEKHYNHVSRESVDSEAYYSQRVHVDISYILGRSSKYMGTPLATKYLQYTYMDHVGPIESWSRLNIFSVDS